MRSFNELKSKMSPDSLARVEKGIGTAMTGIFVERIHVLREKIARESAIGALDSFGIPHTAHGVRWFSFELEGLVGESEIVGEALEYLTLTNRLEWHPKHKGWVRVTEVTV